MSFIDDLKSVASSKATIILSGLATSIIIARILGPEKNGIIAALTVYPSIFMKFGSLGIGQSTTHFVGSKKYDVKEIFNTINHIWIITALTSTVACYLLIHFFNESSGNLILIILAILHIPFTLFNTYYSGYYLGRNRIKDYNLIFWLPGILSLISVIFLVIVFKLDIYGALLAGITGPFIISLVILKRIKGFSINFKGLNTKLLRDMLSLGLIYALALLVINLNYKVNIIILDQLSTPHEIGIYTKGAHLIEYLWQIPMLLSTLVFARSSIAKDGIGFSIKVAQLLRISVLLIICLSIVLFFFSDLIIHIFFGKEFAESSGVLKIMIPGVVLLTIFKVLNMDLAGKGKPWVSIFAMLPALIINIFLNIVLIPRYGANGAAISSTISYSLGGILFVIVYSKTVKVSIKTILSYKHDDINVVLNMLKSRT
jgi:O-antigen/teichoic acid export membrane protein